MAPQRRLGIWWPNYLCDDNNELSYSKEALIKFLTYLLRNNQPHKKNISMNDIILYSI